MNPDTIAQLRTESLAATLTAARGRRVRRRAGMIAFTAIALAVITLSILPRRVPAPAIIASRPVSPVVPQSVQIFRTAPGSVARITTRQTTTAVRVHTDPASRVGRIDTAGLARCFPDRGVAVIQPEGELAKVVFF